MCKVIQNSNFVSLMGIFVPFFKCIIWFFVSMTAPNSFKLSLPNIASKVLGVGNRKNLTIVFRSLNKLAFL